jgi:hypothetical protein
MLPRTQEAIRTRLALAVQFKTNQHERVIPTWTETDDNTLGGVLLKQYHDL